MKRIKHNLSLILYVISTFLLSSDIAIAMPNLMPNLESPVEILTAETTTLPAEVKSAVLNDAVKRTSKTVSAMKILEVQAQQWSDGCLGLGKADEVCLQAIISGYRVVVTDGLRDWTYRTDDMGDTVRLEDMKAKDNNRQRSIELI